MRALALLPLLLVSSMASAADYPAKVGEPYAAARTAMLKAGWKLVTEHDDDADARCGFREEECATYPEASACSGTGMAFCAFEFRKGKRRLRIVTVGESVPDLEVYDLVKP